MSARGQAGRVEGHVEMPPSPAPKRCKTILDFFDSAAVSAVAPALTNVAAMNAAASPTSSPAAKRSRLADPPPPDAAPEPTPPAADAAPPPNAAPTPAPTETAKDRRNRVKREKHANEKAAMERDAAPRVARPWEHVAFYTSRLDNAGKPGGTKILGNSPERCQASDGCVHKNKSGDLVVYVHAHKILYTREQIAAGALNNLSFKKDEMKGREDDRLLILDPVTGNSLPKPEGALHPLHIFLSAAHEYDATGERVDKSKKFKFVFGNGEGCGRGFFPSLSPERAVAMAEAVANANLLPFGRRCSVCDETGVDKFSFQFDRNKYILMHKCNECNKKRSNARNAAIVKTEDGKAGKLASTAIQRQNRRRKKYPHLPIPFLDLAKVKGLLSSLVFAMITPFLALPCCVALGVKSYHVTLDKLDDDLKYYIGFRARSPGEGEGSSGEAGGSALNLSKMSLTVTINNGRSNPTEEETAALLRSYDLGEAAARAPSVAAAREMVTELKSQIAMGDPARYSSEFRRVAAKKIRKLAGSMKDHQNTRRKVEGREDTMRQLTEDDMPFLRRLLLDLLLKQDFRCFYSFIPLCPAELHGFKMSPERLDDNLGYEVPENVVIVFYLFQAKMRTTQRTDEDGNEEFENIAWSRDLFFERGRTIFGDEMRYRFTDLPLKERRKHEAAISAVVTG